MQPVTSLPYRIFESCDVSRYRAPVEAAGPLPLGRIFVHQARPACPLCEHPSRYVRVSHCFDYPQEVFGRFGTGAWNLLKSMAERAEQEGRVCKETFVHNTLLHLSVALCRGNCWVLRKGLHELTRATGRQFQRGLLHPTADLVA